MLGWLFGSEDTKEMTGAKSAFHQAVSLTGDSREIRALRIRAALRSRDVLDKVFLEGARETAVYAEECMIAVAGGEPRPPEPKADEGTCYQTVKSLNGRVLAYVPLRYTAQMYALGGQFERNEISAVQAIECAEKVASELADTLHLDLYLVQPIELLEFLREQLTAQPAEPRDGAES